jgi:hypothetical protein
MLSKEEVKKMTEELGQFGEKYQVEGYLVSAKTGENIGEAFERITKKCIEGFGETTKAAFQTRCILDDI